MARINVLEKELGKSADNANLRRGSTAAEKIFYLLYSAFLFFDFVAAEVLFGLGE